MLVAVHYRFRYYEEAHRINDEERGRTVAVMRLNKWPANCQFFFFFFTRLFISREASVGQWRSRGQSRDSVYWTRSEAKILNRLDRLTRALFSTEHSLKGKTWRAQRHRRITVRPRERRSAVSRAIITTVRMTSTNSPRSRRATTTISQSKNTRFQKGPKSIWPSTIFTIVWDSGPSEKSYQVSQKSIFIYGKGKASMRGKVQINWWIFN